MSVQFSDLKVGQKVRVRTWDDRVNVGIITEKSEDIKNDRPGICYLLESGDGHWCYLYQIISVEAVQKPKKVKASFWSCNFYDTKTSKAWFATLEDGEVLGPFKTKAAAKAAVIR